MTENEMLNKRYTDSIVSINNAFVLMQNAIYLMTSDDKKIVKKIAEVQNALKIVHGLSSKKNK